MPADDGTSEDGGNGTAEPSGGDAGVGEVPEETAPASDAPAPGVAPKGLADEPTADPDLAAPSQNQPAPPPKADSPSAETESEAALIARANGHNVVVDSATTETTLVEALPGGTFQMTSSTVPVRVQRNGDWVDIDPTLSSTGTGYFTPAATTVPVRFTAGGTGPVAQIQLPSGEWFSESLELGTLPAPTVEGATATYSDVIPDVDLRLTATAMGMTEVLVINTAAAAVDPRLETLKLKVNGASIATSPDGGTIAAAEGSDDVELRRGASPTVDGVDAETMLRANEPMVWDSSDPTSGPEGPGGNTIAAPLDSMISGGDTLAVDVAAVSSDDDTVYPLYVDPDFGSANIQAWSVNQTYPNTHYWNVADNSDGRGNQIVGFLPAGWTQPYPGDGLQQWGRSFWQMSTAGSAGKQIIDARFNVRQSWNSSCASTGVRLFRATNIPSAGASWNESVGVVYNGPSDVVNTNFGSNCAGQSWVGMNATQAVTDNGTGQAIILALAASDETHESWKRFNLDAQLVVVYNTLPTVSTPHIASPLRGCAPSSDPVYINTSIEFSLRAGVNDVDAGQNVEGRFRVVKGTDGSANAIPRQAPNGYLALGFQASGSVPTIQIKLNELTDGMLYAFGVSAWDEYYPPQGGVGHDSSPEQLCFFVAKNSAPPLPVLENASGPFVVGKTMSIDFKNPPDAKIAAYAYWWVAGNNSTTPMAALPVKRATRDPLPGCPSSESNVRFVCPNSLGVATVTLSPIAESSTLWVASYDKAMNISATTTTPVNVAKSYYVEAAADTANVEFGPGHGWRTAAKEPGGAVVSSPFAISFADSNRSTTGPAVSQTAPMWFGAGGPGSPVNEFPMNETSTIAAASSGTIPVFKDVGGVALNRIVDPVTGDHAVTQAAVLPTGYNYYVENQLGQMAPLSDDGPLAGFVTLRSCRQPSGNEFATASTTLTCDGVTATPTDLGYIWPPGSSTPPPAVDNSNGTTSPTPAVKIYRCKVGSDDFVSTQANCEGKTFVRELGWVWNRTAIETKRDSPATDHTVINTVASFTVSAWVQPQHASGVKTYNTIVSTRSGGPASTFTLAEVPGADPTKRYLRFCLRPQAATAATVCATDPNEVVSGDWAFVTGIWDSVNRQIRLVRSSNGIPVATAPFTWPAGEPTSNYRVSIGSGFNNSARVNMWGGLIANVTIFPGVASETQIYNLYNLKAPNTPKPTGEGD
ncbi:LamG-like jellyroll fold domain-containing protein [Herbiconiux sp. P16]|uniref:LamG-like jellyroll fold domain-containing protein n=1 Tax=Herbiconiux wuyangfengii TaxID=3342794 RepID=UPI003CF71EB4